MEHIEYVELIKKHSIGGLKRTGINNRRHKAAKTNKTFRRGETIGTAEHAELTLIEQRDLIKHL